MMTVTPLYAAVLALLFVALTIRVVRMRGTARVALGDGGNQRLQRCQRAHGNFAEYVPLALVLMTLAELQGTGTWLLHLIGAMLTAGRLIHAANISRAGETIPLRVAGMVLTLSAILAAAVACLFRALAL